MTEGAGSDGAEPGAPPLVRCFAAAFLTRESARRLQAVARESLGPRLWQSDHARRVPLANYHVTLKFLGALTEPAAAAALRAVEDLAGRELEARATGLRGFPQRRSARLVAAELETHPSLEAWWAALQKRLGAEDRGFRPHVTVLRLRRPRPFRPLTLAEPVSLVLCAPRLYRSDQTGEGVRYAPVDSAASQDPTRW